MFKRMMTVVSFVMGCLALVPAVAREKGDCLSAATALGASQQVQLVDEYDPEFKEYYGFGCRYYKVTLAKGTSYTIWISGDNAQDIDLSVDTDWDDESAPMAMFDYDEKSGGATKIAYLYADSWDEEDPSKGTYYVYLSGEIGARTTLQFVQGIRSFSQEGEEGNPRRITMSDTQQQDVRTLVDGEFYYAVKMAADRKYRIRTTSGTAASPLSIFVDSQVFWEPDPDYTNNVNNAAILVYPDEDIDFSFSVNGNGTDAFVVKYQAYPFRLPEAHGAWGVSNELGEANGFAVSMVPGRLIGDKRYYDPVIDESLARTWLASGQRMVFETAGATGEMEMRVYDAQGNVLASNRTLGKGSLNCRAAVVADGAGWYYVGVRDPKLEYWDEKPSAPVITLTARDAADFVEADEYDPDDDAWEGATLLSAVPVASSSEVDFGVNAGSHVLSGGDWYDWLALPCRKGITYALKAGFDSEDKTDLHLFGKVYRKVDGVLTRYSDVRGSLTPAEADEGVAPLIFTADRNGMYYIRVNVSEGVGLDYPSVRYCAVAYLDDKTPLGLVSGQALGLDAGWYLTDDAAATYPSGAVVAVPAGNRSVRFVAQDAENFATPAKVTTNILAWAVVSNVTTVVGRYTDVHDPADDVQSGYVKIYPTHDSSASERTLWSGDGADWFRFTAVDGVYYNFAVEDRAERARVGAAGDATMTILAADGTPCVEGVTKSQKRTYAPGKYFIKVGHADAANPCDSCYDLVFDSVNAGTLSFESTSVAVTDDAGFVDLVVTRSASEGAVRLNFATVADTAEPGKQYYPTNGIITWADGDGTPKTIRVRLIPDLVQKFAAQQKFNVKIWPMAEDSLGEGEYAAVISGTDVATVKVRRMTSADPGSVELVSPTPRSVRGGTVLQAVFRRTGGTDGSIAVKVKTQSSTAFVGTEPGDGSDLKYVNKTLTWGDGEADDKIVEVQTWETAWVGEPKQFRFKLSTLATGAYEGNLTPALPESKIYVTIDNALQPGTIVMREPATRETRPGETMRAVFSRVGGSSGSIAVKVKTQTSTALVGTAEGDGSDLKYVKQVLTWADGDTADKTVEVPVWPVAAWRETKQFRFKLSTLATGEYAGNLTPKLAEDKIYIAIVSPLAPVGEIGGPAASVVSGTDADGQPVAAGRTVQLVEGVRFVSTLGSTNDVAATSCAVVDGALPPGLYFKGVQLKGVPKEAGDYSALIQVSGADKRGTGLWLDFHVASAGTGLGSFSGVLCGDAMSLADGYTRLGSFVFTAAADGAQTAKIKVGSTTYVFDKANGYDRVVDRDENRPGQTMSLVSSFSQVVASGDATYTNLLEVSIGAGAVTNGIAVGQLAGTATLTLNVLGTSVGVQEDVLYEAKVFRNCSDSEAFVAAMESYAGYYTVSLVPFGATPAAGVPCGAGYVTLTVDETGLVQGAGLLADGKSLSFSARGQLIGDLSDPRTCAFYVPVFQKASPYCFGGVLKIDWKSTVEGGVSYNASTVDSYYSTLEWFKDGATASYDGLGFALEIRPTGGWYNTLFNLQTYYLNRDFTVEAQPVDGLPSELLPTGCTYTADTMPHGVSTLLNGNAFVPASRVLVSDAENPALFDLAKSVNPWKVTTVFARETGILTGTFKAWNGNAGQFKTYSHYGILPMYRDARSPLDANVFTAGFYLMPVTEDWTASLPFDIRFVEYESRDWSETAIPSAE